jgi:ParB-like chromosome segregation protein Spo0J
MDHDMARKRETVPVDEPPTPPMTIEEIPLGDLHEDPANARRHPERNLATIRASLARFGQVTPIVVDANNVVRKGNGTLMAARQLGWAALKVTRTTLSGVDAAAYGVVDNRSSEQAEWDDEVLATTLEAIRSEPDFPLEATGFDEAEVAALLEKIAGDHAGDFEGGSLDDVEAPGDFAEHDEDIETEYRCPSCSYRWSGKPK